MTDDMLFIICCVIPIIISVIVYAIIIVAAVRIIRKQRKLFSNDSIKINIEVKNRTDDCKAEQKQ